MQFLKELTKLKIIFLTAIITGLPIWFTTYAAFESTRIIFLSYGLLLLFAALLSAAGHENLLRTALLLVVGMTIAFAIKVMIDADAEPMHHHLWQLELTFIWILSFLFAIVGGLIGIGLKGRVNKV